LYGVPTCDKIRKTQILLKNHQVNFEFVNVRKGPIPKEKLAKIVSLKGIDFVLNRNGILYRKLGLKDKHLDNDQLFEELFNEQGMIKRPLIEIDSDYHIGYDEDEILAFLK